MASKTSIERRLSALEKVSNTQEVTIIVCGMQVDPEGYRRISKGNASVYRNTGETYDDFQSRALAELATVRPDLFFAWAE